MPRIENTVGHVVQIVSVDNENFPSLAESACHELADALRGFADQSKWSVEVVEQKEAVCSECECAWVEGHSECSCQS